MRSAEQVAATAVEAANAQHTVVPGQDVAATIVAEVVTQLLLDERIKDITARVTATFRSHPQAEIIEFFGMGPILGAEMIAAAGDLNVCGVR